MLHKYYSILGLTAGADKDAIKRAYRRLVMVFHPDRGPECRQRFVEINEAYDALMNPNKHAANQAASYADLNPNVVNMKAARDDVCRRGHQGQRKGHPGQRRFECIKEQDYIGTRIKARA